MSQPSMPLSKSSSSVEEDIEGETNNRNDSNQDNDIAIAKKEDKVVWRLRLLAAFVLISAAIAVCLAVYYQGRVSEQRAFETEFKQIGSKVVSSFENDFLQRIGVINRFSAQMTFEVQSDPSASWPFYTPPDFDRRGAALLSLAKILSVYLVVRVETEEKQAWETYAQENQGWIAETIAYQLGVTPDEVEGVAPVPPFMFNLAENERPTPETGEGPYFPIWVQNPAWYRGFSNLNMYGNPLRGRRFIDELLATQKPVFPNSRDFVDESTREDDFTYQIIVQEDPTFDGSPFISTFYPVFDSFREDKKVVAILLANLYWREYFEGLLPENTQPVTLVLENECNQSYTYSIEGSRASFVDFGDLHDSKYDDLEFKTDINALLGTSASDIEGSSDCKYKIRVFPSVEFEESYYTNQPRDYALAIAGAFFFTCVIFILYDYMVERRQMVTLGTATKSERIVSEHFPKHIKDRLYAEQNKNKEDRHGKKNWTASSIPGSEEAQDREDVIAQVYEETTILYADLAGFTRWSASRTPGQVFELLETLYSAFDELAAKYKVFKVETIGDCYVAVTGLPNAQIDHAVIMCKFARSCLSKMHETTAMLAESFGKETTELELRIGLHSGPVTAGVLRGQKSRFQLFGDSVNKVAVIENRGIPGRVHCSQTTADALTASNKSHWLVEREEKIVIPEHGEMQTFWVQITSTASTTIGESCSRTESENE